MLSEETNIYRPIFKTEHDSKFDRIDSDGRSWCTQTTDRITNENLDKLADTLMVSKKKLFFFSKFMNKRFISQHQNKRTVKFKLKMD